jgi:hypothetical protein
MDTEAFVKFLKRGGRSESARTRVLRCVKEFEQYLADEGRVTSLDQADMEDLEAFVNRIEQEPKASAKTHLWALRYYYEFSGDEVMYALAGALREQRIVRRPFALKDLRGVNPDHVEKLSGAGIWNVEQMLEAGRTPSDRQSLAERAGVPLEAVEELVKLSDLARIPGMKGVRTRLYHDAGVDTVEKLAGWDPERLRGMLVEFVTDSGFDGIAPLPKEVAFSVAKAGQLPAIVEW